MTGIELAVTASTYASAIIYFGKGWLPIWLVKWLVCAGTELYSDRDMRLKSLCICVLSLQNHCNCPLIVQAIDAIDKAFVFASVEVAVV